MPFPTAGFEARPVMNLWSYICASWPRSSYIDWLPGLGSLGTSFCSPISSFFCFRRSVSLVALSTCPHSVKGQHSLDKFLLVFMLQYPLSVVKLYVLVCVCVHVRVQAHMRMCLDWQSGRVEMGCSTWQADQFLLTYLCIFTFLTNMAGLVLITIDLWLYKYTIHVFNNTLKKHNI